MIRHLITFAALLLAAPAAAQTTAPPPMNERLFPFPGVCGQPPSATSAGLAQADAWLGDEPFYNPAAAPGRHVVLSPTLLRVSRQDLRAANRNYDEQGAFFDFAGAALALPSIPGLPGLPVWIYASQPGLRLEDYAFTRGTGTDLSVPPALVAGQGESREGRAGLAASSVWRGLRVGAAFEWTWRQDLYRTVEQSGDPEAGEREASFSGNGMGGALGVRFGSTSGTGRWTIGLGLRYLPALEVEGESRSDLLTGSSTIPIAAEREAGWEGGLAARYAVTEAFDVLASAGHRTEQEWKGLGFTSGAAYTWRLAVEYDHPEDPWAVRFGLGQDQQTHVPEPRADVVGLGIGWDLKGMVLDVGAMRRSFERTKAPKSYDDRLVASVRVDF